MTVYRLTIANSVEERIIALQESKRELAKAAIEGGKAVGKLNMQDILRLFGHDAERDTTYETPGLNQFGKPADVLDAGIRAFSSVTNYSTSNRRYES